MPWSKEHKHATKQRIVEAAAAAFRERGLAQTGVADVMQRAGLTHGGFYAHFKSKDALVGEAFAQACRDVTGRAEGADAYLDRKHLLHPEFGCPFPTLGPEMTRGSAKLRRTFGDAVRARLTQLEERLTTSGDAETQATGALACMVGALLLARGLTEAEAEAFLERCRAFLRESVGDEVL